MRATRVRGCRPIRVVISHENITPLKLAEVSLAEKSQNLEKMNSALQVLLKQREEDKQKMDQAIFQNIKEDVIPLLEQLSQTLTAPRALKLIELIQASLGEITSPLIRRLSSLETVLTPREIQIARLIKSGKSTKEIADLIHLSVTTVSFHRRNLRKKLNVKNTKVNLRSHLLSMSL